MMISMLPADSCCNSSTHNNSEVPVVDKSATNSMDRSIKESTGDTHKEMEQSNREHAKAPNSKGDDSADDSDLDTGNRESRVVFWLKMTLLLILCVCNLGIALAVFYYTTDQEEDEFESRYIDGAEKVLQAIGSSLYLSLGALDAFAVDTVSFIQSSHDRHPDAPNATAPWPFATSPNFAVRAAKLRTLSRAFIIIQYNYVESHLRRQWEDYSVMNDAWVDTALQVQRSDRNYHGHLMDEYVPSKSIYNNYESNTTNPGPYLVVWQSYPMVPIYPPYNWDAFSYSPFVAAKEEVLENAKVVIRCSNLPDPSNQEAMAEVEITNDWASAYLKPDDDPSEPQIEVSPVTAVSVIVACILSGCWPHQKNSFCLISRSSFQVYYPLTLESPYSVTQDNQKEKLVVGVLTPSIYWRELISDILPVGTGGVDAVFQFGESIFTYNIDGAAATYLGQGDQHDTRFDYLKQSARLLDLASRSKSYTGLPLSEDMKDYVIHIYPSSEMEDHFSTSTPAVFTAITVIIFTFTSLVFFAYDRCVERRQRKIVHSATRSRENVLLLEQMVRERTSKLEASNKELENANHKVKQASELQLQHFACMSHEIRTPLNCIIGLSSLMEETELNPLQRDNMRMIVTSGDLLRAVVDDVLDYSKLETGNIDVKFSRSNLQQILSSVVHSIEMRGLATDVSLTTYFDPYIPEFVNTDSRRLQQILYNLLGNAVKFSKSSGTVELRVSICSPGFDMGAYSPPPPGQEEAKMKHLTEKVLRFDVKDSGKGIDEKDYVNIFQPFIQTGEEADSENIYGGTGLGLPITAKLIHGFGGRIAVVSKKGEWTKFTVDLPFLDEVVDVNSIASGLKETTVLLVTKKTQAKQQVSHCLNVFHVRCDMFNTMVELSARLEATSYLATKQPVICLVQEDLFDKETYQMVVERTPSVLLTFGSGFIVEQANDHLRSLTKILPSALISSMLASLKAIQKETTVRQTKRSSRIFDPSAPYASLRYLIAEDNVVNTKVLCKILERLGIPTTNVETVDNGQKAVDREAEKEFDIVLMDMQMPVLDGIDACRLINERCSGHPRAKVIFVTAHVQDSFKEECQNAGSIGFLAKPCTLQAVEDCLRSFCSGRMGTNESSGGICH